MPLAAVWALTPVGKAGRGRGRLQGKLGGGSEEGGRLEWLCQEQVGHGQRRVTRELLNVLEV